MNYKIQPGIVLLKICDVNMLVATREMWEKCPTVRPIPRLWAMCWSLMEKGRTSKEVTKAFSDLFHSEKINASLERAFTKLYDDGLLIAVEEETTQ